MEVRGRYGRQGHRYRRPCRDVFLRRPLLRAHGPAAGHPAGLADDVWQPRRAARAPGHEISRHLPAPHHAALHRPARLRGRRGVLFSEQHHPPLAGQDVHPAQLRARQVARARDPRKHLLQPDLRLQRVRQEERPRRPAAPPDDLRLLRRIQQRTSHRRRLRPTESLHRQAVPRPLPLRRTHVQEPPRSGRSHRGRRSALSERIVQVTRDPHPLRLRIPPRRRVRHARPLRG